MVNNETTRPDRLANMSIYGQRIRTVVTMPPTVAGFVANMAEESGCSASSAAVKAMTSGINDLYFIMIDDQVSYSASSLGDGCSLSAARVIISNNNLDIKTIIKINPVKRSIRFLSPAQVLIMP